MIYTDIDITLDDINITESHFEIIKKVIEGIYDIEKLDFDAYVSVIITDKEEIRQINLDERGIDSPTDVLSFPAVDLKVGEILDLDDEENIYLVSDNGLIHFGDMAICMAQLKRQAKEYNVSNEAELKKLVIHSMLHFMGYDHIKDSDYEVMNKKEMVLDSLIKIKVGE